MSEIKYRAVDPEEWDPPEGHEKIGEDEFLAPEGTGLDALEEAGKIEVLDWDYSADGGGLSPDVPPEPLVRDSDGSEDPQLEAVYVAEGDSEPELRSVEIGTWECARCGVLTRVGVEEGELREPHACRSCERQGPFTHAGPLSAADAEAAVRGPDMWHPPGSVVDLGYSELWNDVREFIREYWDAGDDADAEATYAGLTAYALSTWVRENMTFVPHLMLMGKTTDGKTRLLNTLARVSYRAVVPASATPASMFRLIDAYDTTFYVSEYHGLHPDTRRELDAVVRAGQKRGEIVTRAEQTSVGHEPRTFDPFAHVAIATQFEPDDDIVNRCIQITSSSATRDIPATFDEEQAERLRNRLLYARFRLLESDEWEAAEQDAYATLAERGIDGRTREKLLGLLTVAHLWDKLGVIEPFIGMVVEQDKEAASDSEDALVVEAIRDLAHEQVAEQAFLGEGDPYANVRIPYSDEEERNGVLQRYEDRTGIEKSSSWLGHVVKRLDLGKKRTADGTVIQDSDLGPKLRNLCNDLNLAWDRDGEDADRLPQAEAREAVRSALEDADDGGGADRSDVLDAVSDRVNRDRADAILDDFLEKGELYRSEGDVLRSA